MKIQASLFENTLQQSKRNVKRYELQEKELVYLRKVNCPKQLLEFLLRHSYKGLELGPINYYGGWKSKMENESEANKPIIGSGLLIVGSGANGDPIAVDITQTKGEVGFVSHDVVWESPECNPREHFAVCGDSIGKFLADAETLEGFPADYYEAKGS